MISAALSLPTLLLVFSFSSVPVEPRMRKRACAYSASRCCRDFTWGLGCPFLPSCELKLLGELEGRFKMVSFCGGSGSLLLGAGASTSTGDLEVEPLQAELIGNSEP
jgi:hypothetical protein